MTDADARARTRFILLSLLRLGGALIALAGAAIIGKRLVEPAELVGGSLMLLGIFEVLVLPVLLARHWRTPPAP